MKLHNKLRKTIAYCLAGWMAMQPLVTAAEDIDIFVGAGTGSYGNPNVLIVLDNTSNWARQAQQWPGGLQQGQAEVRAIKNVISTLGASINVGVMGFVTNGTANDNGGYVRFPILPMTSTNKTALAAQMDIIFNNINSADEKRNSGTDYGNLFFDVYNYFSGANVSLNGSNASRNLNPPSARVNSGGYATNYSKFLAPLSCANNCAKNYVIFVTNPDQSGPAPSGGAPVDAANVAALAALGGDTGTIALPNFTMATTSTSSSLGDTSACYASQADCNTAVPGIYNCGTGTDNTYSSCTCSSSPVTEAGACAAGTQRYSVLGTDPAGTTNLGYTSVCVANANSCTTAEYAAQCTGTGVSCACNVASQTTAGCPGGQQKYKYMVVRTKANTTVTNLGYTSACYATQASCSTAEYLAQCATFPGGCACGTPTTTGSTCPAGTGRYAVTGFSDEIVATPDGTYNSTKGAKWTADEWARFMYQKGAKVDGCDNQTVATYTIDVYNKQQNGDHTALMLSTARVGGGKYFAATNEDALVNALKKIFQEITSVNSTFASASLPVNATNRAQNENQVFIGMFRPDAEAKPRWFGNLKRYQLVIGGDGVTVELGDKDGRNAINNQTGFVDDCAISFWTTDSPHNPADLSLGYYWNSYPVNPNPASKCLSVSGAQVYSDLPDGPTVEKGAVAEVMRKGNNPSVTDANPTWAVNRNFLTTSGYTSTGTPSSGIDTVNPSLTSTQKNWLLGQDTQNEDLDANITETRGSLHGDVVHSRPLPVNYGDQVVVYYGANDGNFRAVNADTGKEMWTLVPYEFAQPAFIDRLRSNEPLVSYPSVDMSITPTPIPKDYAWDGSIGVLADYNDSHALTKAWIFPTMRRGGKRVYALDVTSPTAPSIKWIVGCNKDGSNCTTGFGDIGQTWSTPNPAPVAGYAPQQVVFFGGGYDSCEDVDTPAPACGAAKGRKIYAVDADSGALLRAFDTDRSVPSDVALLDINADGKADYAYAADTGGNLYRIDMVSRSVADDGSTTYTARAPSDWTFRKIGSTANGRKFLFGPALFPLASAGRVYVAIGSGDREHPLLQHYPFEQVTNRFYVYLDNLAVTSGAAINLDALKDTTTDLGCDSEKITPSASTQGWFFDLNQYGQGEQTVTSAIIAGGLVAFSTNRPIPPAEGTCDSPLGEARGYWVNLLSGSGAIGVDEPCGGARSGIFVGGGLPPSPVIGTVPINGRPTTVIIGAVQREGGASTPISPQKVKPLISPIRKRVYWKLQGVD